jgi:hypothetical protein
MVAISRFMKFTMSMAFTSKKFTIIGMTMINADFITSRKVALSFVYPKKYASMATS